MPWEPQISQGVYSLIVGCNVIHSDFSYAAPDYRNCHPNLSSSVPSHTDKTFELKCFFFGGGGVLINLRNWNKNAVE
jgi:hypothetical protein